MSGKPFPNIETGGGLSPGRLQALKGRLHMKIQRLGSGSLAGLVVWYSAAISGLCMSPDDVPEYGSLFSITEENDLWSDPWGSHQDRHYTHGIKLAYIGGDRDMTNLTSWVNPLFFWGHQPLPGNFGFVAGQSMYTPEDILETKPILTDRPYAGWLYGGLVYQRRNEHSAHYATMENFELNIGIVGPDSEADDTQILIHTWEFPDDIPAGWGNQLHDEAGFLLKYARLWRFSPTDTTARFVDVLPRVGLEVGNVAVIATAGMAVRLGWNLPPDFGVPTIESPVSVNGGMNAHTPLFSCYVFVGADGSYVAHDITLDGNTFCSSQSVEKYNWVGQVSWGCAVGLGRHIELSYTHINRSQQFFGQQRTDVFGSLNVKIMFRF
jgi:lipid A 3-O-deacylase